MYQKPTKNYKMSKQAKMMLANHIDPHKRGELKRGIIQAELAAAVRVSTKREPKQ